MWHPSDLCCPSCESEEVCPLNEEGSSWICERCLTTWLWSDEESSLLKLQELIDAALLDCPMSIFEDLRAASYYLDLLKEGLIGEEEAKRKITRHLSEAQSPPDWINLVKDSL
jgi:hypothetical protein